ncbi:MAG: hypothetical protein JXR42_06315 [Gammaproteobacteria bacterium]|nr:hypothetical protein [Gammaproteobacteria bacterium]
MKINEFKKIAIIVAMQQEAEPIIAQLGLLTTCIPELLPELGMQAYRSKFFDQDIYLFTNGIDKKYNVNKVATQPAAITALETIMAIKPDLIISAGTAGGIANKGLSIGDVCLGSDYYMYHDRRIPSGDSEQYGIGYFSCPDAALLAKEFNLKTGIVSTGNSLTLSQEDEKVLQEHNVLAKEMEVAAIAEVASMFNIPVLAVKAITNIVGIEADVAKEFKSNFNIAVQNLSETLAIILTHNSRMRT